MNANFEIFYFKTKTGKKRSVKALKAKSDIYSLSHLKSLIEQLYQNSNIRSSFGGLSWKGDNLVNHCQNHLNKKFLLNTDIKNFYSSLKLENLLKCIRDLNNQDILHHFIENRDLIFFDGLPEGSPTSPILSHLILLEFDLSMESIANKNDLTYSRYYDDISISSNKPIPPSIIIQIQRQLDKIGLELNISKTHYFKENQPKTICGLTVGKQLGVKRKYRKKLEAILHNLTTKVKDYETFQYAKSNFFRWGFNHKISDFDNYTGYYKTIELSLRGKINFIKTIYGPNSRIFLKLLIQFKKAFYGLQESEFVYITNATAISLRKALSCSYRKNKEGLKNFEYDDFIEVSTYLIELDLLNFDDINKKYDIEKVKTLNYRKTFHSNINCNQLYKNYTEKGLNFKNSGLYKDQEVNGISLRKSLLELFGFYGCGVCYGLVLKEL